MTVIAYDGQRLAADSMRTMRGDVLPVSVQKLVREERSGRQFVMGLAGDHADRQELFERWLSGKPGPPLSGVLIVVELLHRGGHRCFVVDERSADTEVTSHPIAIGSGSDYATGAMLAGASAMDAISIAAQRVLSVAAPVQFDPLAWWDEAQ